MAYGVVIIEFSGCFYNKEQIGVEKWTEEDLRFLFLFLDRGQRQHNTTSKSNTEFN